jgi:DNA-binding CsgD family transcriptional regulator
MAQLSQSNLNQILKFNRLTLEVSTVDELLNQALVQMEAIFAAPSGMFLLRPEGSLMATFDRHTAHGLQEGFFRAYSYHGLSVDPFARALLSQPGIELQHEVQTGSELVPYEDLMETSFYWNLMRPYGIHHMLRIELVINQRSIGTVGLFRPMSTTNFSATDSTKAMLVTSALASALDRALQNERYREDFAILENSAPLAAQAGLLILDENLSAIYCDANARKLCNSSSRSASETMASLQLPPALLDPIRSFWDRFQRNARKTSEHEEVLVSIDDSARPTRAHACAKKTIHGRWRILVFLQPDPQPPCQTKRLIDLGLTKREAETVELVVAGLKNTEIAAKLAISINTVQCHLHTIFHKLGIRNRAELIGKVTMPMSIGSSSMTQ